MRRKLHKCLSKRPCVFGWCIVYPRFPKGTIFSPCQACICMHTSGWAVKPFGSDALYHAKLDWIKIWTCLERTVLMKGIFSTFGSVKSSLSNRKETKCWVMLFIPFQSTGFTRQWRQTSCRNQTKTVYRMITKSSFVYKDSGTFMSETFNIIIFISYNLIIDSWGISSQDIWHWKMYS